jgi:hypothetical protein
LETRDSSMVPLVNDRDITIKLVWITDTESIYSVRDRKISVEGEMGFFSQQHERWYIDTLNLKSLSILHD